MARKQGEAETTGGTGVVRDLPDGPADESGLTPRQRKVLEVIRDSVERRGYPPTVREIGEAVGLTSTSSVSHQLAMLQKKGFLRRDPSRPRAVDVRMPGETAAAVAAADLAQDELNRGLSIRRGEWHHSPKYAERARLVPKF